MAVLWTCGYMMRNSDLGVEHVAWIGKLRHEVEHGKNVVPLHDGVCSGANSVMEWNNVFTVFHFMTEFPYSSYMFHTKITVPHHVATGPQNRHFLSNVKFQWRNVQPLFFTVAAYN